MTEQARLTGDRSTNHELNDSIAFSRYIEAIDRISHQYLLWEEAQSEFRNYQEIYRTAEGLVRSIGVAMPITTSPTSQDIESLPYSNIANQYICIVSEISSDIRNLQQDIENIHFVTESSINKLEVQKEECIRDSNQEVEDLNCRLKGVPYPQPDEITSIVYKIKKDSEDSKINKRNKIFSEMWAGLGLVLILVLAGLSVPRLVSFFISGHKFDGNLLSLISFTFSIIFTTLVGPFAIYVVIWFIDIVTSSNEKLPKNYGRQSPKDHTDVLKRRLNELICESQNYSKTIEKLKQEILVSENTLKRKVDNFNGKISNLSSSLSSDKLQKNEQINNLKNELIGRIKRISDHTSTATSIALELSPIEFEEDSQECKLILGLSLKYWEIGSSDLSASRMLARPWEDDAWMSSYHPHLGTQTPDCISIGNYLVDRINPERRLPRNYLPRKGLN